MSLFSKIKGYFARGLSGYDSGNFKRQNSGWTPVSGTAESLNAMQRNIIRERARDLERNSDDINSLIEAFEKNVVGTGIKLQAKIRKTDDIDSEDDEKLNTLIEHKFAQWCKAENCDIGEEFSFADIQRLCQRRRLVDGGIFVIFVKDNNSKSPFKLQLKEVSELDESVMSQVNYSSARQSLLDDRKTYDIHRQYMIDKLFRPVYERWLYESVKRGDIVIKDFFNNPERYYQAQFIPNGYNWIDPLKEVKANATALETNQTTLEEICAGQGKDYRDVIKQRSKEQKLINQLSGGGGDDEKTDQKDNKNPQ